MPSDVHHVSLSNAERTDPMFCHQCGNKLPDDARFCGKCGARIAEGQNAAQTTQRPLKPDDVTKAIANATKDVNGGTYQLVEGALSVVLALMVLFAPVLKVDYGFGKGAISMLDVVVNLSKYSDFLGDYAAVGPIAGFFTIAVFVSALLNAKQAFMNELPKTKELVGGVKFSDSYAGAVTGFALALIVILGVISRNTYGIAGASGWAWLLLVGGLVCQLMRFIRVSLNAPHTNK